MQRRFARLKPLPIEIVAKLVVSTPIFTVLRNKGIMTNMLWAKEIYARKCSRLGNMGAMQSVVTRSVSVCQSVELLWR